MALKKKIREDFGDIDHFDDENITDSDDEFSDTEKQMLEKVRKKRIPENFDSDDEVLGLNLENEDDNDDSMDSDIDRPQEDDDLPDDRAWGKQKRTFYSTDYVDPDYSTRSDKNLAAAELEEQESRKIRERLIDQMDEAAFGLDLLPSKPETNEDGEKSTPMLLENLSKLSKREKKELLKQESPELEGLVKDLKDRLEEARSILSPFLKLAEKKNFPKARAIDFLKAKYHLILNYCVNLSFYMMLKAKKISITNHPVIKRIAQYRQLLAEIEGRQGDLLNQASELLQADKEGKTLYNILDNTEIQTTLKTKDSKKKRNKKKQEISIPEFVEEEANKEDVLMNEESDNGDEEIIEENVEETYETTEDQKRAISYQIAKNRGLTPYRKKELRNPRVKHRNKYRKAKISRKGAVREVRQETTRYAGEVSGIRASTVKSIKFKH